MSVAPMAEAAVGRVLERLAKGLAYVGGVLLVAIATMTVVSVIGRKINTGPIGPIPGDFELIELGCALAVFAFLPWCQMRRGHVSVEIVVDRFPKRVRQLFSLMSEMSIAAVAGLILWRGYLGFGEKFPYFSAEWRDRLSMGFKPFFAETSYELEIPVWIPMGLALIGATLFCVVAVFSVWRALNVLLEGRDA